MLVLAVPLYFLYELGLILCRVLPAERVAGRSRENA
jgi:Sec-independent protein secretion pathway component TatC